MINSSRRIERHEVEMVKSHVDITQVIQKHVKLQDRDLFWEGTTLTPDGILSTIRVNKGEQVFYDLERQKSGDVFDFLCRFRPEQFSFKDAVLSLAQSSGLELKSQRKPEPGSPSVDRNRVIEIIGWAKKYYHLKLIRNESLLQEFMARTCIDIATILRFEIGYSGKRRCNEFHKAARENLYCNFELRYAGLFSQGTSRDVLHYGITVPISDREGNAVAFAHGRSGVSIPHQWLYTKRNTAFKPKGILFGLHLAKDEMRLKKIVYMVSDIDHVFQLHRLLVTNVLCLCGEKFTEFHAMLIKEYCHTVVVIGDETSWKETRQSIVGMIAEGLDVDSCLVPHFLNMLQQLKNSIEFLELIRMNAKSYLLSETMASQKGSQSSREQAMRSVLNTVSKVKDNLLRDEYIRSISITLKVDSKGVLEIVNEMRELNKELRNEKLKRIKLEKEKWVGEFEALRFFFIPDVDLKSIQPLFQFLLGYTFAVDRFRKLFELVKVWVKAGIRPGYEDLLKTNEKAAKAYKRFQNSFRLSDLHPLPQGMRGADPELVEPINMVKLKIIETRLNSLLAIGTNNNRVNESIKALEKSKALLAIL